MNEALNTLVNSELTVARLQEINAIKRELQARRLLLRRKCYRFALRLIAIRCYKASLIGMIKLVEFGIHLEENRPGRLQRICCKLIQWLCQVYNRGEHTVIGSYTAVNCRSLPFFVGTAGKTIVGGSDPQHRGRDVPLPHVSIPLDGSGLLH